MVSATKCTNKIVVQLVHDITQKKSKYMRQESSLFGDYLLLKVILYLVDSILQEHPDKQNTPFIYFTKDTLIIIL